MARFSNKIIVITGAGAVSLMRTALYTMQVAL